ncbi:hypothetical protein CFOUR_04935 [Corynebacterium fournieri]|nr:hypothetical protein CFOUR_04935 [Corynebacterium fournieri]
MNGIDGNTIGGPLLNDVHRFPASTVQRTGLLFLFQRRVTKE